MYQHREFSSIQRKEEYWCKGTNHEPDNLKHQYPFPTSTNRSAKIIPSGGIEPVSAAATLGETRAVFAIKSGAGGTEPSGAVDEVRVGTL